MAAIARHPGFDAGSLFNDLAVLILGKQLKFDDHIDKICLPPKDQDVTQFQRTCIATGWGKKALQGMQQDLSPSDLKQNDKMELQMNVQSCNYINQFVLQW